MTCSSCSLILIQNLAYTADVRKAHIHFPILPQNYFTSGHIIKPLYRTAISLNNKHQLKRSYKKNYSTKVDNSQAKGVFLFDKRMNSLATSGTSTNGRNFFNSIFSLHRNIDVSKNTTIGQHTTYAAKNNTKKWGNIPHTQVGTQKCYFPTLRRCIPLLLSLCGCSRCLLYLRAGWNRCNACPGMTRRS